MLSSKEALALSLENDQSSIEDVLIFEINIVEKYIKSRCSDGFFSGIYAFTKGAKHTNIVRYVYLELDRSGYSVRIDPERTQIWINW